LKQFPVGRTSRVFLGLLESVEQVLQKGACGKNQGKEVWCYNVVYEDGDTEHLEFAEIEALHQQQKHLYAVRLQEQRLQQQQQQQSTRKNCGLCDGHSVSTLLAQNTHKSKDDNPHCEELKRQKRRRESTDVATETSVRPEPIAAPITHMTSPSNGSAGQLSAKETARRPLRKVTPLIREQAAAGNGSNKHSGRVSSTGTMASATSKAHPEAISEAETASTNTSKRRNSSITIVNSGEAPSNLAPSSYRQGVHFDPYKSDPPHPSRNARSSCCQKWLQQPAAACPMPAQHEDGCQN